MTILGLSTNVKRKSYFGKKLIGKYYYECACCVFKVFCSLKTKIYKLKTGNSVYSAVKNSNRTKLYSCPSTENYILAKNLKGNNTVNVLLYGVYSKCSVHLFVCVALFIQSISQFTIWTKFANPIENLHFHFLQFKINRGILS